MKVRECLDSGSGSVQASAANINLGRKRENLKDLESWCASAPGIAEYRLGFAVEVSQVWSSRIVGPQEGGLVECLFDLSTLAEAGLVASCNQDPPLLRLCACRLDA